MKYFQLQGKIQKNFLIFSLFFQTNLSLCAIFEVLLGGPHYFIVVTFFKNSKLTFPTGEVKLILFLGAANF